MGFGSVIGSIASVGAKVATGAAKGGAKAVKATAKGISNNSKKIRTAFVDNVLVGGDYKEIAGGRFKWSNKGSIMDEAAFHVRGAQNAAIGAWEFATNGIGEKHYGQLLKRTDNSFIGYKATGLGKGLAFGAAVASGVPAAARTYNEERRGQYAGVYQMGAIPGLVPQGHAYANNAGATGDLVLALNNNR